MGVPTKTFNFRSILDPNQIVFVLDLAYDEDLWMATHRANGDPLGKCCGYYRTHGDGDTRHSPTYPVSTYRMAADYMISFATAVNERLCTFEPSFVETLAYTIEREVLVPKQTLIRFALETEHKADGKPRYVHPIDEKVSAKADLIHDRRWFALDRVHDGTAEGAVRFLQDCERTREKADHYRRRHLLERLFVANAVDQIARDLGRWSATVRVAIPDLQPSSDDYRLLDESFTAFQTAYNLCRNRAGLARQVRAAEQNREARAESARSAAASATL